MHVWNCFVSNDTHMCVPRRVKRSFLRIVHCYSRADYCLLKAIIFPRLKVAHSLLKVSKSCKKGARFDEMWYGVGDQQIGRNVDHPNSDRLKNEKKPVCVPPVGALT